MRPARIHTYREIALYYFAYFGRRLQTAIDIVITILHVEIAYNRMMHYSMHTGYSKRGQYTYIRIERLYYIVLTYHLFHMKIARNDDYNMEIDILLLLLLLLFIVDRINTTK